MPGASAVGTGEVGQQADPEAAGHGRRHRPEVGGDQPQVGVERAAEGGEPEPRVRGSSAL